MKQRRHREPNPGEAISGEAISDEAKFLIRNPKSVNLLPKPNFPIGH
jgi:hypothetical protein